MIDLFKVKMSSKAPEEVSKVLMSGFIGQGPKVDQFEETLRNHFQTPYINTVNSGTSGLELAIQLIKNHQWDENAEILTTPLTCTATNLAILARGVKLRWIDIEPKTCNIDIDDAVRKINKNTKAIMLVHWGGIPVDLDRLRNAVKAANERLNTYVYIIEDCAHAWGSKYKGKLIGTHGNFSVFSFQAIKHLTTGDGGMIISPMEYYHKEAKLLRWYGLDRTSNADFRCAQDITNPGFKWHMNDIAATIGLCNYECQAEIVHKHKENGQFYNKALKGINGVQLLKTSGDNDPSYWIYTILVEHRFNFIKRMKEKGIMVSQVHDRNDKHTCFQEFQSYLPNLENIANKMISIPCGWWVTPEDRQYIVDTIKEGW